MPVCESCSAALGARWHCLDCDYNVCETCKAQPRSAPPPRHETGHLFAHYPLPPRLTVEQIKEEIVGSYADWNEKVKVRQRGVPTFYDNMLRDLLRDALDEKGALKKEIPAPLLSHIHRRKMGRYADYFERKALGGSDIPDDVLFMSQGVSDCLHWKGHVLFKTAFDVVIYQELLSELAPKTIFEIGSGDGGSALWLADLADSLGLKTQIYSVDVKPVEASRRSIKFVQGDCRKLSALFDVNEISVWPRPWLVIEDAHADVAAVLEFFDPVLRSGDYLIVEDSVVKENTIGKFMLNRRENYKVDVKYTDLFGRNATCSPDSIFKRMK